MKNRPLLLGIPFLVTLPGWLSAQDAKPPSSLLEGVKLEANGETIAIKVGHLVPNAVDWNADGKNDLVLGQFSGGKVRLYLNQGTNGKPRLEDASFLESGGVQISVPAG